MVVGIVPLQPGITELEHHANWLAREVCNVTPISKHLLRLLLLLQGVRYHQHV